MIDESSYKELKKNLFSKIIRESTAIINNLKLIIEEKRKYFI